MRNATLGSTKDPGRWSRIRPALGGHCSLAWSRPVAAEGAATTTAVSARRSNPCVAGVAYWSTPHIPRRSLHTDCPGRARADGKRACLADGPRWSIRGGTGLPRRSRRGSTSTGLTVRQPSTGPRLETSSRRTGWRGAPESRSIHSTACRVVVDRPPLTPSETS